ncbi:hypothetical protein Scep_006429 [Stephania cephalantha]|uniref:Uncharacterized protein n=1 Tax=Stephania cephalantha TaxID=152367 RepID=A0AAP0K861_9MAGN
MNRVRGEGEDRGRVCVIVVYDTKSIRKIVDEDRKKVVMAPMARRRAYKYVPQEHTISYYSQHTTKGGLLITKLLESLTLLMAHPTYNTGPSTSAIDRGKGKVIA